MKRNLPTAALLCAILLCGCNKIPEQSIINPLTADQLHAAAAQDSAFGSIYTFIRTNVDSLDRSGQERYRPLTYRRVYTYLKFIRNRSFWTPLIGQYNAVWNTRYGDYSKQADSVIDYWKGYRQEHSLNRYVRIRLAKITPEGDWGFELTPLRGRVEQLQFKYRYVKKSAAAADDSTFYPGFFGWEQCVQPTSFASPVVRYWHAANEEDRAVLQRYADAAHFLRDYRLYAEVTAVRVGGKELTEEEFELPLSVQMCLGYGTRNDSLRWDYYVDNLIKDVLCDHYVTRPVFTAQKTDSVKQQKDPLCFDFVARRTGRHSLVTASATGLPASLQK